MFDVDIWDQTPGWLNEKEARCLYSHVMELGIPGLIVEIGCFRGRSTIAMLMGCRDKSPDGLVKVISVDNFSGDGNSYGEVSERNTKEGRKLLYEQIMRAKLGNFFQGLAAIDSRFWFDQNVNLVGAVDMFFVDGCHLTTDSDIRGAWRYLRPGGVLLCHDYDPTTRPSKVMQDIDNSGIPGRHVGIAGTSIWKAVKP